MLRVAGKNITDIDAVGEKGRRLLLVSCKSIIYSGAYDAAEYVAIRNAQGVVEAAVDQWDRLIWRLTQQPVGDNFDFSGYREVLGVVCTPFPVYTNIGPATREVAPGLRAAAGYAELADWLSSRRSRR